MNDIKIYTEQRRQDILRIIRHKGTVSVRELTEQFHVSGTTIRLDLAFLERTEKIIRTHGGAILDELSLREPLISERIHEREKADIAVRAMDYIENRDVLLIDTGTSMVALAQALVRSAFAELTVYSNDLEVLRILEEKENWNLCMLGGPVRNGFHYTCGPRMIQELQKLHFRKLFLATSAISFREGLTTANPDLALLKAAMIASAEKVFLLADASKLHRVDFQKFADLSDIDVLITDRGIARQDLDRLAECIEVVETADS